MRLTIIPSDNTVYVDGVSRQLDLSMCAIPTDVHAMQWNGLAGWVEFIDNEDGTKPQNQRIDEIPAWANACVEVWNNWVPPASVESDTIPLA